VVEVAKEISSGAPFAVIPHVPISPVFLPHLRKISSMK
jgi:hypothetical protein